MTDRPAIDPRFGLGMTRALVAGDVDTVVLHLADWLAAIDRTIDARNVDMLLARGLIELPNLSVAHRQRPTLRP